MKKFFRAAAIAFAAVMTVAGISSCNTDDDSVQPLTSAEIQQCFLAVGGNHSGELYFRNSDATSTNDQLIDTVRGMSWEIPTDSTMIFRNVPAAAFAQYLTDKNLKAALSAAPARDLECKIGFISVSPVTWLVNPAVLTYNLNYDGADHEVKIGFLWNSYYSFGTRATIDNKTTTQIQLLRMAVQVDGVQASGNEYNIVFSEKK